MSSVEIERAEKIVRLCVYVKIFERLKIKLSGLSSRDLRAVPFFLYVLEPALPVS